MSVNFAASHVLSQCGLCYTYSYTWVIFILLLLLLLLLLKQVSIQCSSIFERHYCSRGSQVSTVWPPLTAECRVPSQVSPCVDFSRTKWHCDGPVSQHFSFSCQYHPINAPHSCSSTRCSYQDERRKSGDVPKGNALSEIGEYWLLLLS